MSTPILIFEQPIMAAAIRAREEATREAAVTLPVCFKVTRRVDVSLFHWWQRWLYGALCRRLPAKWRVPPVPPLERGNAGTFDEADAACETLDDQLHIMPWAWFYAGDRVDREIVCRPRDTKDAANAALYAELKDKYSGWHGTKLAVIPARQQPVTKLLQDTLDWMDEQDIQR